MGRLLCVFSVCMQFSNKMLLIIAGTHKLLLRKANREDPDQTASSVCLGFCGRQLLFEILEHLPYFILLL